MEITNLEFSAPTKAEPTGQIKFNVLYGVSYSETKKEFDEFEGQIEFSEDTTDLLRELKQSMISDLKDQ
jgi:hypothetical protein